MKNNIIRDKIYYTLLYLFTMPKYSSHSSAIIETESKIGDNTKIWHFAHIRAFSEIGENCIIGKDVYVDQNVKIGNNVKVQNGVSIYDGVTIEDDVFLGPHMTFTNDLNPRSFNEEWVLTPTLVKRGASIGAHATIVCGVELGEYSMIGSGSVVTKDVPAYGLVYGNPAKLRGFVCKCGKKALFIDKNDIYATYKCSNCDYSFNIDINHHWELKL